MELVAEFDVMLDVQALGHYGDDNNVSQYE